jgi:hypothetical protein
VAPAAHPLQSADIALQNFLDFYVAVHYVGIRAINRVALHAARFRGQNKSILPTSRRREGDENV